VLKLAAELETEERPELAEALWGAVPKVGQRLTFDEMLREIKASSGG
jgi:hypothetical protein